MDPARSERLESEALTGADRDARIEQLLLTGLDHYFANDYDQAINLWSRVLFLDRHHDRARAYIERARSAQAERQRESEAMLHQGLDAFRNGDVARARELLRAALDQGASRDLALGVLDRIERLDAAPSTSPVSPATSRTWLTGRAKTEAAPSSLAPPRRRLSGATILLIVAALGAATVGLLGVLPDITAWRFTRVARPAPPILAPTEEQLPLASATELYIARSRTLFQTGRLRDALRELDRVPIGDALRPDADRLRAEIQTELLAVAAAEPRATHEVP
jgi:tetratricopeptide (TPR) repeat protein